MSHRFRLAFVVAVATLSSAACKVEVLGKHERKCVEVSKRFSLERESTVGVEIAERADGDYNVEFKGKTIIGSARCSFKATSSHGGVEIEPDQRCGMNVGGGSHTLKVIKGMIRNSPTGVFGWLHGEFEDKPPPGSPNNRYSLFFGSVTEEGGKKWDLR